MLGVVENLELGPLQGPVEIYVGVLAATILFIATNAGLIGVSRLTYSMGQYRQLPERLRALHPRYRTPYVAITVFGAIACLTIVPGQAEFLGTIYAFGAMLSFTMAHLSVVRLRMIEPERERPYRGPGNLRLGGVDVPLFAVVGALDGHRVGGGHRARPGRAHIGRGLARAGRDPLRPLPPPPGARRDPDREGDRAQGDRRARGRVRVRARRIREQPVLAGGRAHRGQAGRAPAPWGTCWWCLQCPPPRPSTSRCLRRSGAPRAVVRAARALGGRRVTGHWEKARRGEAGRRIVDEARARSAPGRLSGRLRVGVPGPPCSVRTLEAVLEARPCRVIDGDRLETAIGLERQAARPGGAAAAAAAATGSPVP